jgi:hypothetical protein
MATYLTQDQVATIMDALHRALPEAADPVSSCWEVPVANVTGPLSLNAKGYIQVKVPDSNPNHKVIAHTVVVYDRPHYPLDLVRLAERDAGLAHWEVSHRCRNKRCIKPSHLVVESSACNKSRTYCEVVIYINGIQQSVCRHTPRCKVTQEIINRAYRFQM